MGGGRFGGGVGEGGGEFVLKQNVLITLTSSLLFIWVGHNLPVTLTNRFSMSKNKQTEIHGLQMYFWGLHCIWYC